MLSKNQIKHIRSLQLKKNRVNESDFIVEGEKMVNELLSSRMIIKKIFATKKWIDLNISKLKLIEYQLVSEKELIMISNLTNPNNVFALVKTNLPSFDYNDLKGITLILDDIRDPGNLGTIIRLCDWFNVSNIICSNNSVDVFNYKVVQSTMGSLFRVNIFYKDLVNFFHECPYDRTVYGAFLSGSNIKRMKIDKDAFLVVGNESNGISDSVASFIDEKLKIENVGPGAESLNVACATSILLYQFC